MAARAPEKAAVLTLAQALEFIERHGIVCESAHHAAIATLVDAIAGEVVRGSWWTHPQAKTMFALTRAVREAPQVLVCRLLGGKITFVHERLWPALVRAEALFSRDGLARVQERHSATGKHVVHDTPFPDWVPAAVLARARRTSQNAALALLAPLLQSADL